MRLGLFAERRTRVGARMEERRAISRTVPHINRLAYVRVV